MQWDVEMAAQYKLLAHNKGFVHMYRWLREQRKSLVEGLVVETGHERSDLLRGAIWTFDMLLKLPDEMLANGAESEGALYQRGITDDGTDERDA